MSMLSVVAAIGVTVVGSIHPGSLPSYETPRVRLVAADNTLGPALMSAVVATNGSLVSTKSVSASTSSKTAAGTYTVQFVRNVTDCAYVAALGDTATALPPVGSALVSQSGANASTVFVETIDAAGALTDASFHLMVFCGR